MKLLLTSVFGPFGVDDDYGKKENKMELFHNQVTREQGIFSYRFNHNSFGLYLLAENVGVPTAVLDFPKIKRFIAELKKGYDYVGISFIMSNFDKAKKMAMLVREVAPQTKIILGGHGVAIPNIEDLIEHDYICKGEGIKCLRELFGEDVNAPIKHPTIHSSFNRHLMGLPLGKTSGVLMPGVGCPNKCRFCSTSHFFGEYCSFLKTGKAIYDVCCAYEDKMGVTDFGVLDENFLKMKDRVLELLELMEKNGKSFTFSIFSSAEAILALGDLDLLVRLGVQVLWIGVESKKEIYEKNKGVDLKWLFDELQKRGISVLASAILFLEHHDKKTIWDDVDFAISLKPDYLQFMELGPVPGTALYKDYDEKNKLLKYISPQERHGQDKIWFKHPNFTREESRDYLTAAFQKDYKVNGASLLRAIKTSLRGYRYAKNHQNEFVRKRMWTMYKNIKPTRALLFSSFVFKQNKSTALLIQNAKKEFRDLTGRVKLTTTFKSLVAFGFVVKEFLRIKLWSDVRHPKCFYKKYGWNRLALRKNCS